MNFHDGVIHLLSFLTEVFCNPSLIIAAVYMPMVETLIYESSQTQLKIKARKSWAFHRVNRWHFMLILHLKS